MTMERRGVNVMEFQLGVESMSSFNQSICHDQQFPQEMWVTQGRINVYSEEACPIRGEYTGIIPDAVGLCAKLYSDCRNPQTMFYSVSNCQNLTEVYEGSRLDLIASLFNRYYTRKEHTDIRTY